MRLFPPDIPAGKAELPTVSALLDLQKKWEADLINAHQKLKLLQAQPAAATLVEEHKMASDKQLRELQSQLQALRDAMLEYRFALRHMVDATICSRRRESSSCAR